MLKGQGVQQPVVRTRAYTDDLDEGIAATRLVFGNGVEIDPPEHGGTTVALACLRSPQLQYIRWHMSGTSRGVRDDTQEEHDAVLAGFLLGGRLGLRTRDDDALDVTRPFLYPEFVRSRVAAPDLAVLAVARDLVDAHAYAMTGNGKFQARFSGCAPVTPAADRLWSNTMRYAQATLAELADLPAGTPTDLATTGLLDLVATQLLHTFPNSALAVEQDRNASRPQTTHAPVRRAMRFIEDNLGHPFSVVDLAEASGLSLRGLHAAFLRELDVTPMRFVRQVRLAAAREDLKNTRSDRVGIGDLALRWGFHNLGHFERLYRNEYDETPEDTLRS
jgi:AraC-like DNA-binding protein